MKINTAIGLLVSTAALVFVQFATPALARSPSIDQWGIGETFDPMTDKRSVHASVFTKDGLALSFHCFDDKNFTASIEPLTSMMRVNLISIDEQVKMAWRIDKQPTVTESWIPTPSGTIFAGSADSFARAILAGGSKVTFRVNGQTAFAKLDGASENIAAAMLACNLQP